jgi:HEAT repeat protein
VTADPTEHSPQFQWFLLSFRDDPAARPPDRADFDLGALLASSPAEKEAARKLLTVRLITQRDTRVPRALAALRDPAAVGPLRMAVQQWAADSPMSVECAIALNAVGADQGVEAILQRVLTSEGPVLPRQRALRELDRRDGPDIVGQLIARLEDGERNIRQIAAAAIFHRFDLLSQPTPPRIGMLLTRIQSHFIGVRAEALEQLEDLIDAKQSGNLGTWAEPKPDPPSDEWTRFVTSRRTRIGSTSEFDLLALRSLVGVEREAAATMMLSSMVPPKDSRVPGALCALGEHLDLVVAAMEADIGEFSEACAKGLLGTGRADEAKAWLDR